VVKEVCKSSTDDALLLDALKEIEEQREVCLSRKSFKPEPVVTRTRYSISHKFRKQSKPQPRTLKKRKRSAEEFSNDKKGVFTPETRGSDRIKTEEKLLSSRAKHFASTATEKVKEAVSLGSDVLPRTTSLAPKNLSKDMLSLDTKKYAERFASA